MQGSFHNPAFPIDEIRPPQNQDTASPNILISSMNMFPQNTANGPSPPVYSPN